MTLGLVGRKVGMTRIFTDDGQTVPVTVVDVSNNRVTQIKTAETDGYASVQVAFGKRRATRVNKAAAGHFAKAGVEAGQVLREFRVEAGQLAQFKPGDTISPASVFAVGQKVDVTGTTIGKVVEDQSAFPVFYQPGHPDADASGKVLGSNVDLFQELVDMQVIERSFDANLQALRSYRGMLQNTITNMSR